MVIYLKHPEHGTKVACEEVEAVGDEKNGWSRFNPFAATPQDVQLAEPPEEDLEVIRARWAAKFGKKPHHKKTADSLKKELE